MFYFYNSLIINTKITNTTNNFVVLVIFVCIMFGCESETEIDFVEQKPMRILTAYDSFCEDISKGNRFKFDNPYTKTTKNITNSFAPNCYPIIKRGYYFNDSATNFIDLLEIGDTLHINYIESGCHHFIDDIYSIIKQPEGYSLLKYSQEPNNFMLGFLKGDSCLIAFHDSLENKFKTHILPLKDTSNLNKLAKKYVKQSYKSYNYKSMDIYNKIKNLENITTTNTQCRFNDGRVTCKLVFLLKNGLQERYYLDGGYGNFFLKVSK